MKFNLLVQCLVHLLILISCLRTLNGKKQTERSSKRRNIRDKTNIRITDRWLESNSDSEGLSPTDPNRSEEELKYLKAAFSLSKPKPWRKDGSESKKLNQNNEIPVELDSEDKRPVFMTSALMDRPSSGLINQNGCGVPVVFNPRVVNGQDAKPGAYPWMVAILKQGDAWCGGAIINEQWVLSASHCFMTDLNPRFYAIRVGTVDRNSGTTYKVDKVIVHERFHLDNMFNSDIALVRVNQAIKMSKTVKPVCLPTNPFEDNKASNLLVTGWGQTSYENKELPTILQEVTLTSIKIKECAKKYQSKGNVLYYSQLCTWRKGQDACQGDSGAPAIEWRNKIAYLVGIVSYGSTCADEMPGVYTKVSHFVEWILKQLEEDKHGVKKTVPNSDGEDYMES